MIIISELIKSFDQIIGWPYKLGGRSQSGIDCSGAFVRAYQQQGQSIYHGSNRIIRAHCTGAFTIERESQLEVGMAIFKQRADLSKMKAEYKPGGRYYNEALPNDYYHIGLVTGVNPLSIVNATTPVARRETRLSNWTVAAYLIGADYGSPPPEEARQATVVAQKGSTVNLRSGASLGSAIVKRVPLGEAVTVTRDMGQWCAITHQGSSGYMMTEFLKFDTGESCDVGELTELRRRVGELEALLADEQG